MAVSAAPAPNIAPLLAGAAVIAGIGATLLRLPGGVIALILLLAAAWMSTPPPLTGKKDAAGYPTVGNPGEERALLRHRSWSYLRWRLIFPSRDWLLNDPESVSEISERADRLASAIPPLQKLISGVKAAIFVGWLLVPTSFVSMAAVGAALLAYTLPVDALDVWAIAPSAGLWLMWPNAAAAYVIVKQIAAARRRFAAIEDPRPTVTVSHLVAACKERDRHVLAIVFAAVGLAAATVTATLVVLYALNIAWLVVPAPVAAAGAGLIVTAVFLRAQSLPEAHIDWENTVAARAEWVTGWQTLKVEPPPHLLSHTRLGGPDQLPVRVDTFEAPATLGSAGALGLLPKIAPTRGAGMRVSVLNEADVDGQGQPMPGSKHPLRFTVVAWPVDTTVDVSDPDADQDMVRMLVRTAAAANTGGWPQPMLVDFQPAFTRGALQQDAEGNNIDGSQTTAAYATVWAAPDVDAVELMPSVSGGAAGYMGTEAIADKSAGAVMYIGALTTGTTVFTDHTLGERFEILARESEWVERWHNVLKMGEQKPWIQSVVYKRATLASGQIIECQPFMTPQGIQSEVYISDEKERKLQSTLNNAPFVSVIGWPIDGDRPGERHPGAFRVLWSAKPIPANPALIPPGTNGLSGDAVKWALSAAVNRGFDSAKLPRPEMISASALTSRQSKLHIWDLTLRLYGGVTLLAVKAAAEKIRQGMGAAEWLRITGHPEGVRLVVGATPQPPGTAPQGVSVQFARPRNRDVTTALDWEQVFIDAKLVSPVDASAPKLTQATTLETNDQVESLVFSIPRGLSITDFQEPKAVDRLRVNARKVFIDVRHTDTADTMQLLVCEIDPMPLPAPFMWDVMGERVRSSSFGTSVEGAPVTWDLDLDSHLLVLGSNGSGKGIAGTAMLTDMLMSGWDVYAADPNKGFNDFAYADPWLKLRATTYPDTVAIIRKMVELLEERKQLNSSYGVSNIKDLPADVRPPIACMFMDEFTSLIIPEVVPKLGDNPTEQDLREHAETTAINSAKATIGSGIGRILREGRATGLVMVLMGQKLTADILKYVPGGSTLKDIALDTRVPVPVSEKFPTGWATNEELAVGDLVFAIDGTPTAVVEVSDVFEGNVTFQVSFDDGQSVVAGKDHLWLASNWSSRRHQQRRKAEGDRLRDLRAVRALALTRAVESGIWVTADRLAEIFEYSEQRVRRLARQFGIERMTRRIIGDTVEHSWALRAGITAKTFAVADVLTVADQLVQEFGEAFGAARLQPFVGERMNAKEIASVAMSRPESRDDSRRVKRILERCGVAFEDDDRPQLNANDTHLYELNEFSSFLHRYLVGLGADDGTTHPLEQIVTTGDMAQTLIGRADTNEANWAVRIADPLLAPDVELPVDPYVFGAWLGDGNSDSAIFTQGDTAACTDEEGLTDIAHLITEIERAGYSAHRLASAPHRIGTHGINAGLRQLGVRGRRGSKFIPALYLRASERQRLALLQGLMDTDGTVTQDGQCIFAQVDRRLADQVLELARSLGIKAHFGTTTTSVGAGHLHTVLFTKPPVQVFRLPRKARRLAPWVGARLRAHDRRIVSIERVPSVPTRCIAVEHPDHTFLVEGFIPTHNSQMSRLAMGKMNFGDMMSAFNDAAGAMGILGPSVPRGRGIFESTAQAAFAVQTWWGGGSQSEHFSSMVDHISAARQPLAESERFDPEPYRPAVVDNTPVFGRRIDDDAVTGEIIDIGVVDLGEIDLGIAEGISFDDFDFDTGHDTGSGLNATTEDAVAPDEFPDDDVVIAIPAATSEPFTMPDEVEVSTGLEEAARSIVTFVGPGAPADDPTHVDVDELPPGPPVTGSPAVDAMCAWVAAHPGVTEVRWVSPLTVELDDIGLSHGELADSALRELGVIEVVLHTPMTSAEEPPEDRAPVERTPAPLPPTPRASAPAPAAAAAPATKTDRAPTAIGMDDLFDSPTHAPVHVTDDLFD